MKALSWHIKEASKASSKGRNLCGPLQPYTTSFILPTQSVSSNFSLLTMIPVVLQNVMLYVIRVRILNSVKNMSQGLPFKSQDQFIFFVHFDLKFLQVILQ